MILSAQVPDSLVKKIDSYIAENRTREITDSIEDIDESRRIARSEGAAAANNYLKQRRLMVQNNFPRNRSQFVLAAIEEKCLALEMLPRPEKPRAMSSTPPSPRTPTQLRKPVLDTMKKASEPQ